MRVRREKGLGERGGTHPSRRWVLEVGFRWQTIEENEPKEREKTLENMIYKNRIEILTADCQIEPNL